MDKLPQQDRRDFMKTIGWAAATALTVDGAGGRTASAEEMGNAAVRHAAGPVPAVDLIRPIIGTGASGNTFPGAVVPFGLVQLNPDTAGGPADPYVTAVGRGPVNMYAYHHCGGYHYPDNVIVGFSHTHLSGTGCAELQDVLLMPTVGAVHLNPGGDGYASRFSHKTEIAQAGYYAVFLDNPEVRVELTATTHCGMHRYTFPSTTEAHVILDLVHGPSKVYQANIQMEDDHTISGYRYTHGWAANRACYFVMQFSRPIKSLGIRVDDKMLTKGINKVDGVRIKAHLDFDTTQHREVLIRVSISGTGIEGARKNLQAEIPHWNFEAVHQAAEASWRDALAPIEMTSGDPEVMHSLQTASYHCQIGPTLYCDVDGTYRGQDGKNHRYTNFHKYTALSIWDIYRCEVPMLTMLQPGRINDIITTMLADYRQLNQHAMPMWPLWANETWGMVGYHSAAIVAAAYFRGFRDYDAMAVLDALIDTANQDRNYQGEYRRLGYITSGSVKNRYGSGKQSVSTTLDYAWDDWCIGQLALAQGRHKEAAEFLGRSSNWKHVFDPETGFMRGKLPNGQWREPFVPEVVVWDDYTEANAWQASWWVPQDMGGLVAAHGGDEPFVAMLDRLFTNTAPIYNWDVDITGLIGQCAQGNEPSNQIPYLYVFGGAPWKTQYYVRLLMEMYYGNTPQSLPGNDDIGQLSAWYLAGVLGFYPVNPVTGVYVLGSPRVDRAVIKIPGTPGKFTIIADHNNLQNVFVQSVSLNGKPLERTWITHQEIVQGGELHFKMGRKPNKEWGRDLAARPPSGLLTAC